MLRYYDLIEILKYYDLKSIKNFKISKLIFDRYAFIEIMYLSHFSYNRKHFGVSK